MSRISHMTAHSSAPRILLAWEQGRNLGHIGRLLAIARAVDAAGGQVVLALPPAHMNAPALQNPRWQRIAAPQLLSTQASPATEAALALANARADSFADILLSLGLADATALTHATRQWLQLLQAMQPHSVVLDYAPVAQLATLLVRQPRTFQITNGFDAPPAHCPIFGLNLRGPYIEQQNQKKLAQLTHSLSTTIATLMAKPMPADVQQSLLAVYFNYPRKVFDCIPETDAYAQHRPTPINASQYLGPLDGEMSEAEVGDWQRAFGTAPERRARAFGVGSQFGREAPAGSAASRGNLCSDPNSPDPATSPASTETASPQSKKIFAYLRTLPGAKEWLQALVESQANVLCVWPDVPDDLLQQHANSGNNNLTITRHPVPLTQALQQADAVVSYGGITTVCRTLLAGKPQIIFPHDIEKTILARKIEAYGAGFVYSEKLQSRGEALKRLLATPAFASTAKAIAMGYSGNVFAQRKDAFVRALMDKTDSVQLKKEGE
jgi:hypothetical protein